MLTKIQPATTALNPFHHHPSKTMNMKQRNAFAYLTKFALKHGFTDAHPGEFKNDPEIKPTNYGTVWVTLNTGIVGDEGTMLTTCREHWFVELGKGGKITVHASPKALRQFAGDYVFHMHFAKDAY